jgi:hypothetical protein
LFCPECGDEYRVGILECPECNALLADAPPLPTVEPPLDLVTVFSCGSSDQIALAKSVLMEAGIEFAIRGELVQDLFAWGRFTGGSNPIIGPVQFQVRAVDAADASQILAGLGPGIEPAQDEASDASGDAGGSPRMHTLALRGVKIVALVVLAAFMVEVLLAIWSQYVGWAG